MDGTRGVVGPMNRPLQGLSVRHARADDGPALAAIYTPFVTDHAVSFEYEPPDGVAMGQRALAIDATHAWLVAEHAGELLGYAYATSFRSRAAYRWTVEVSAYLRDSARGCGVGERLYRDLFSLLAARDYRQAIAAITLPNPASVRFHEHFGFTRVGVLQGVGHKFGQAHDVAYYQRAVGGGE